MTRSISSCDWCNTSFTTKNNDMMSRDADFEEQIDIKIKTISIKILNNTASLDDIKAMGALCQAIIGSVIK